jgi:hypothetical protein
MPTSLHLRVILLATGVSFASAATRAQTTPPAQTAAPADNTPCYVAPVPDPCGTKPATPTSKPSTAEKFPFPGETSNSPNPSPDQSPAAPSLSPTPAAKKSAQDAFPFPGENPATTVSPTPGDSSSSSSSSSSSDDTTPDPTQPALTDKGSDGTTTQPPGRHILHRVNPIGTKLQTPDEREAEDLDIAHFYTQTGDLQGAYLRSQDAVKTAPDDPDAHFALAEIARKLNKRDEAIAEYNACLKLDPLPQQASAARKALARLNTPGK